MSARIYEIKVLNLCHKASVSFISVVKFGYTHGSLIMVIKSLQSILMFVKLSDKTYFQLSKQVLRAPNVKTVFFFDFLFPLVMYYWMWFSQQTLFNQWK